jgi:hypothetical protein
MTETPKTPGETPAPKDAAQQRSPEQTAKATRLAKALRDNLRRRKIAHPAVPKPGNQGPGSGH